jgi:hypothetical protein
MKKIVFVCDGGNFSTNAFQFVRSLYEQEPFLVTGAFFHSINYGLIIPNTFAPGAGPYLSYTEEENEAFEEGVRQFKTACEKHEIEFRVHRESDAWDVDDLVKESRFSDLLVISAALFFSNVAQSEAKAVLQQALRAAECPILVLPDKVQPIDEVIVAYDGKKDSVYALKQFTYLFAQYCDLETTIVYLSDDPAATFPEADYIEEFAARHFKLLCFEHLSYGKKTFPFWVKDHKNALLVSGAYNRSALSLALKKSFAEDVIDADQTPVFISHL